MQQVKVHPAYGQKDRNMNRSQVEQDYAQILEGTNRWGKLMILTLTGLLYMLYTRWFGFLFMGLCVYPIAWVYFLTGCNETIFAAAAATHMLIFEITYRNWNDRENELKYLDRALKFIHHHLKQQQ